MRDREPLRSTGVPPLPAQLCADAYTVPGWAAPEREMSNEAVARALEARGSPAVSVRSRAGELAFTIYCLEGCERGDEP
jgi:hypothetical protein